MLGGKGLSLARYGSLMCESSQACKIALTNVCMLRDRNVGSPTNQQTYKLTNQFGNRAVPLLINQLQGWNEIPPGSRWRLSGDSHFVYVRCDLCVLQLMVRFRVNVEGFRLRNFKLSVGDKHWVLYIQFLYGQLYLYVCNEITPV